MKIPAGLFSTIIFLTIFSCQGKREIRNDMHVGDIAFDSAVDNPAFKACGKFIYQYYNFGQGNFSLEKKLIRKHFGSFKEGAGADDQDGYITIRFVVNCQGETDRFRVFEIDTEWNKRYFDPEISGQLLALTKSLKGWKPGEFRDREGKYDFYQFLTFKIRDGKLIDILP